MALLAQRSLDGKTANYWIILMNNYNKILGKTLVQVGGFLSKESSGFGLSTEERKSYLLKALDRKSFPLEGNLTTEQSYEGLKNQEFFEGAESDV